MFAFKVMNSGFKKCLIFILIGFFLFRLVSWTITILESTASPRQMTTTNMVICRMRIFDYIKEHGTLPEYLNQLSEVDGKGSSTKDGWGTPILYFTSSNNVVTLKSIGENLHSQNDAGEINLSFPTKDANGKWLAE